MFDFVWWNNILDWYYTYTTLNEFLSDTLDVLWTYKYSDINILLVTEVVLMDLVGSLKLIYFLWHSEVSEDLAPPTHVVPICVY